jgi:hypothetical protein
MRLGSRVALGLIAGILVAASYYAPQYLARATIVSAGVRTTPFVLKTEYYRFTDVTNGKLFDRVTVGRKSDGTTASSGTLWQHNVSFQTRKIAFPSGKVIIFWDLVRAKSTFPASSPAEASVITKRLENPPLNCVGPGQTLVGLANILGRKADVVKTNLAGGTIGYKWKDPELACLPLQSRLEEKQTDGSLKLLTEERPVSLELGEPTDDVAWLFDEEIGYAEVKPSDGAHRLWQRLGISWPPEFDPTYQHEDAAYLRLNGRPTAPSSTK